MHRGSLARRTIDFDQTAVRANDSINHGEAKAARFMIFVASEERLEHARACGRVHAVACILHGNTEEILLLRGCAARRENRLANFRSAYGEPAAGGHRIARVVQKFLQCLRDLMRIGGQLRIVGAQAARNRNIFWPLGASAIERFVDQRMHIGRRKFGVVRVRKELKLANNFCAAAARVNDRVGVVRDARWFVGAFAEQARVAENDREHVIEIVSDAASQRTETLEVTRFAQTRFHFPAFAQIGENEQALRLAGRGERHDSQFRWHGLSVLLEAFALAN